MKTRFKCEESKELIYRNYSNFSQKNLQSDLLLNNGGRKNNWLKFEKRFVETLDKPAPKKTKYFEGIISPTLIKHCEKLL